MRATLLTITAAALLIGFAAALPSPAGEGPQDPAKDKGIKAARLKIEIDKMEKYLAEAPRERQTRTKNGNEAGLASLEESVKMYSARLPEARLEFAWLKGDVTLKTAEAKAKAAEEALAKSPDTDKAKAQAALDAARKELEAVKALEAKGEF